MVRLSLLVLLIPLLSMLEVAAQSSYRRPPAAIQRILDIPPTPAVSISPTGDTLLLADYDRYPPIQDLARPWLALAGKRIDPATDGPQRKPTYRKFTLQRIADGQTTVLDTPADARLSLPRWSPDGQRLVFTNTSDTGIDLWVAEVAKGKASLVGAGILNDTIAPVLQWMPDGKTLLVARRPIGAEAAKLPEVPISPVIQEAAGDSGPVRTYQDLLENPRDEALFDQHCTAQMVLLEADPAKHAPVPVAEPGIYTTFDPSPDGNYFLVERIKKPYSYLHTYRSFPTEIQVLDRQGQLVRTIADLPLADNVPIGGVPIGPRSVGWKPTEPATLVWAEALDGGDPDRDAEFRDQVMRLSAPFTAEPTELLKLGQRYAGLTWGETPDLALIRDYDRDRRWLRTYRIDPTQPGSEAEIIFDRSIQDRYNDPGSPEMKTLPDGGRVMRQQGDSIYLSGRGASPEGDRPFLDRFNLKTKQPERLFQCSRGVYASVVEMLDDTGKRWIVRRESVDSPPNYLLQEAGKTERPLTEFDDPAPELRKIKKERITYKRKDGVDLSFILYLPPSYQEGQKLPAVAWAYPREYNTGDTAGQVTGSTDRFTLLGGYSHLFFLLAGYAVLDQVSMPVVGPPESANDTFVEQLRMNAQAAIDKAAELGMIDTDRIAVGGHSYGAFMTGNLLAHTDLFQAGIARSGAYNRTLTPFGFQNERRTFWEAPEIYASMSPFFHTTKINEPLLLIHGAADNNPGTFPVQSERLFQAIRGNGGIARLVMLPHESHGYSARESIEHVLAEMVDWCDTHVKNTEKSSD